MEDVAEVFEQRSKELDGVFANRWEVFWDILAGRHRADGSFTGRLLSLLGDGSNALLQWLDSTVNALMNQLASAVLKLLTLFTNAPTYENQADHVARLTAHAANGSGLVLVAHSQGNLFVNSAFDGLQQLRFQAQVKVVHVAPASPSLRGEYVLADIDLVINALRVTGTRAVKNQAKNNVTSRVRLDEKYAARRALLKVAHQKTQFARVCGIFFAKEMPGSSPAFRCAR